MNLFTETKVSQHHGETSVLGLIDPITNDWDIDLLNEFFLEIDVKLITKIPVALDCEDQWSWKCDLRGMYSIKQGYNLLMRTTNNIYFSFTASAQL